MESKKIIASVGLSFPRRLRRSELATQFGKYQIERELGRGATGIVYLAYDPQSGRRVALKRLVIPHTMQGEERYQFIERFSREARTVATLNHPCIPKIYEDGEISGTYYIAMEYCSGQTLRDKLKAGGPLKEQEAVRIAKQILTALQAAHAKGIFHRDVKPENVMLLPDGSVKLMDFGIARAMGNATLTQTGMMFGTPAYMSPEQVSGRSIDGRSDIFSMGVVLHEMLTLQRPFEGATIPEILHAIAYAEPKLAPTLSSNIRNVLRVAFAKEPSQRFTSATGMVSALSSHPSAAVQSQVKPTPVSPAPTTSPFPAHAQPVSPSPPSAHFQAGSLAQPFQPFLPLSSHPTQHKSNRFAIAMVCLGFLFLVGVVFARNVAHSIPYDGSEEATSIEENKAALPPSSPPVNNEESSSLPGTKFVPPSVPIEPSSATVKSPTAPLPAKHLCPTCGGTGKASCLTCNGFGWCSECKGTGITNKVCTQCNGTLEELCPSCNGSGRDYLGHRCKDCRGKGIIRCSVCKGRGRKPCLVCHGSGKCHSCQGTGTRLCNDCGGTGTID